MAERQQTTINSLWKEVQRKQALNKTYRLKHQTLSKKVKSGNKNFLSSWLSEFSWIRYDIHQDLTSEEAEPGISKSPFVKDSKNYQNSALQRHERFGNHITSMKTMKERCYKEVATKCVQKLQPILKAQLQTALWIARGKCSCQEIYKSD